LIGLFLSIGACATQLANYRATLRLVVVQPPKGEIYVLTLVTQISTLLSSIPYLQLFVDQYVEGGDSFSLLVKVLQNWTVQMRILNTP
jgi:hypothetical protein